MRLFRIIQNICCFLIFISIIHCAKKSDPKKPIYSFYVVGHAYGNPNNPQLGLYKPFKESIKQLNACPNLELAFFTGDVVVFPTFDYWNQALSDLKAIDAEVHIAPGNHDKGQAFNQLVGKYNYSFHRNGDLFVVLTPEDWCIRGEGYKVLWDALHDSITGVNNIFIFTHELIWWSPDNEFKTVKINFEPHYPGRTNFKDSILPLLKNVQKPIFWFAGDIGCKPEVSPYMYHQDANVHLIGSGVGNGENDNLVMVGVNEDHQVELSFTGLKKSGFRVFEQH